MHPDEIHVLLVDDDPDEYFLVSDWLADAQNVRFNVEWADSYVKAMREIGEDSHDIYLVDYRLGAETGLDLLEQANAMECHAPIIILTGQGDHDVDVAAMEAGAADYLDKSTLNTVLLERSIRYAIQRKHTQAHLDHLNAVLRAIRNVNMLIATERSPQRLLQATCEALVEPGSYDHAWIALQDDDGALVTSARSDITVGFDKLVGAMSRGKWPKCVQQALQQSEIVTHDPEKDCSTCPLAASYAPEKALSIRLEHSSRVYGVLSVALAPEFIGSEQELNLLKEVAGDIAFALHNIDLEDQREQARKDLRIKDFAITSSMAAIAMADLEGNLTYVNDAFLGAWGYKDYHEVMGKPVTDFWNDPDRAAAVVEALFEKGGWMGDLEAIRPDGSTFVVQLSASMVTDDRGTPVSMMASFMDITERKQAEIEREQLLSVIQDQAKQMKQVIATVPEGVLLLNAKDRIVMANPPARRYLDVLEVNRQKSKLQWLGNRTMQELHNPPPQGRWHEVRANGRIFEAIIEAIPASPQATGSVMVIRDVTEERDVEEQTQQQERLAAIGQLAGGIAHDFNNLLTTITLYAQLPLGNDDLPPNITRALEVILSESRKAAELVQQILDFSRRSPTEMNRVNMVTFVKKSVRMLKRVIQENILLRVDIDTEMCVVDVDATRLQQVLMNLALNAQDAMPNGGELRIRLATQQIGPEPPVVDMAPGRWASLSITDTGTGISPDALPHIFEPFFTTKPRGKGTGLGLAQVYGIVKQHQGHIDVETSEGEGTTFTVYLPMQQRQDDDAIEEATTDLPMGHGEHILMVEDQEQIRELARSVLSSLNYRVSTAPNGQEALERYKTLDPVDLLITDIVMPVMGGERLYQTLKEQTPDLQAIAITGYILNEDLSELRKTGFGRIIHKPFEVEELARLIRATLDGP